MKQRIIYVVLIISITLNLLLLIQQNIDTKDQKINIEKYYIDEISDYSKKIYTDSFNEYINSERITHTTEKVDSILLETYSNILSTNISHSVDIANIINNYFKNINLIIKNNNVLERGTSVFPEYLNKAQSDLITTTRGNNYFSDNMKRKILHSMIRINQSVIRTIYGETNYKFFAKYLVIDSFELDIINLKQTDNILTREIVFKTRPLESIFELFIGEEIVHSEKYDSNFFLDTLSIDRDNLKFEYPLKKSFDSLQFWIYMNGGMYIYCYHDKVKIKKTSFYK